MPTKQSDEPEISDHASIGADKKRAWLRQKNWLAEVARRLPHRSNNAITKAIKGPSDAAREFEMPFKDLWLATDRTEKSYDSGYVSLDSMSVTEWASEWASDTSEALHNVQNDLIKQSINGSLEFEESSFAQMLRILRDDTCLDVVTTTSAQVICSKVWIRNVAGRN